MKRVSSSRRNGLVSYSRGEDPIAALQGRAGLWPGGRLGRRKAGKQEEEAAHEERYGNDRRASQNACERSARDRI
jgi:hypothetical protein